MRARAGPADRFRPHPYAPEVTGGLPRHVADDAAGDAHLPGHPLTPARAAPERITSTVVPDERIETLPPFTGSTAPRPPRRPGGRGRSGRREGR